jgi:hypothetical protein
MRKLFLSCAALGFAAVGLLKTATYVDQNPHSFLGRCISGVYFACIGIGPAMTMNTGSGPLSSGDMDEPFEIPADPEPIAEASNPVPLGQDGDAKGGLWVLSGACWQLPTGGQAVPIDEQTFLAGVRTGRVPGKIVIEDNDAWPINPPRALAPEPNLDRFVTRIEAKWKSDDAGVGSEVTTALWRSTGEYVRQMPYCTDEDEAPVMPTADEPEPMPRKKEPRRIWFPFMPPGTEVGGEKELSPNGNDCREDPSAPVQIPGSLTPALHDSKKLPVGPEKDVSEKQSKSDDAQKKN